MFFYGSEKNKVKNMGLKFSKKTINKKVWLVWLGWMVAPYSVRMRENVDQNNSEYGHFLRSE